MPRKKKSGGKRAVEKKHAERAAARNRAAGGDWIKAWKGELAKLDVLPSKPDDGHGWLGRAALLIVHATLHDTAVPAEQLRRDAMRQIEQASKVLDPAALSDKLAELERALEKLRASKEPPAAGPGPRAGAPQH